METLNIERSDSILNMGQDNSKNKKKPRVKKIALTENAITVLERRYLKKNEEGRPIEKPVDEPAEAVAAGDDEDK